MLPISSHWIKLAVGTLTAAGLLACSVFTAALTPTVTPAATLPRPTAAPTTAPSAPAESGGQIEVLDYVYTQDFSKSSGEWDVAPFENEAVKARYRIDGVFTWEVQAKQGATLLKMPESQIQLPADEFLLTVSMQIQSGDEDSAAGLLFRAQEGGDTYFARLSQDGRLSVHLLQADQWSTLVEAVKSDHFQAGKLNRLIVTGRKTHYEVQVNDYPVASFDDARLQGGALGLIAELSAGVQATLTFDDLRLMQPGSSAAVREEPGALPTMVAMGASHELFSADFNGVHYSLEYPYAFVHSTAGGWERFCLEAPEKMCFGVQAQNGPWASAEDMANRVLADFSGAVAQYRELGRQKTTTGDGLPAYRVDYTCQWQGEERQAIRMFVVVQQVGFDVIAEGDPAMMEVYRPVAKWVLESFRAEAR